MKSNILIIIAVAIVLIIIVFIFSLNVIAIHQLLPPTASPSPKEYDYEIDVNLSCEEGSTIYYTLNNSIVDNHSMVYSSPIPIQIFTPTTIRAKCTKNGYKDSNIFTGLYFVRFHPDPLPLGQLLPPTASPSPKEYDYEIDVNLSCEEGSTIYYTLNNSIVDNHSMVYSSPIPIQIFTPTTIRAICTKNGYKDSNIFIGSYFVRIHQDPLPPLPKST